jgi:hypothetical protein
VPSPSPPGAAWQLKVLAPPSEGLHKGGDGTKVELRQLFLGAFCHQPIWGQVLSENFVKCHCLSTNDIDVSYFPAAGMASGAPPRNFVDLRPENSKDPPGRSTFSTVVLRLSGPIPLAKNCR